MGPNKQQQQSNNPFENRKPKKPGFPQVNFYWFYALIIIAFIAIQFFPKPEPVETPWSAVRKDMIGNHDIEKIEVINKQRIEITLKKEKLQEQRYSAIRDKSNNVINKDGPHYYYDIGSVDELARKLDEAYKENNYTKDEEIPLKYVSRQDYTGNILSILLWVLLIAGLWAVLFRRMGGGMGGGGSQLFNIGRSKAQLFDKDTKVNITFADVAGLEEAKVEVMEIVDFLKTPEKYTKLGGKIPKGALLIGPPGTGKTLLAKAVAGEANVPFFSLSGSDFVEMFVGVGASRVRDLFRQAKEKAPCIIFIDEIDAIGRARGRNAMQGGNDERENTLNQLLTEMDGFGTDSGVIILAATNRPDILDSALMRPGRFDRQISIDAPDLNGREHIFRVHLKPLKLAEEVDPKKLSAQTPGFAGADIMNVCNEAALIAARNNKEAVDMKDFQDAIDRVIGGLEKKNKIISPEEKKIVAFHESGHAVLGWFLEHVDPLVKVSIVPRGVAALGYAQYLPKEQFLYTVEQLTDTMCMTLGGRAAEEIVFGRISTGASNDLERVTKTCYAMITMYGMNERVGQVNFHDPQQEYAMIKPYSEKTAEIIDEEVRKMIREAYAKTKEMLLEKRELLDKLAGELLKREVIFQYDLELILGKRPFTHKTTYEEYMDTSIEPQEPKTELTEAATPEVPPVA
ncbi:MAG: ATP-dependent zinc metalloprotease FtsH [Flavobacteriaceae bacterium]|nr:ATP-dependent zinc metalloprotease FtsH [Flavobacteriaceae bacterium]